MYPKICHHTSNLLVHYLVKWTECIGECCWHDFVIKDVTVNQVTLNVTDMDKINIVSSQAVLEVSSFSTDTRSMSSSPLVNSLVKSRLFRIAPDIYEPPFQFIHTVNLSGRHDTACQPRSRNPQDWDLGCLGAVKNVWCFLTQQFNCCTCAARCAAALSCWNTKSLPDTLRIAYHLPSRSSSKQVSKRYHQNFLLCNNNELTACIADLFNSFSEEVYAVAFLSASLYVSKIGAYWDRLCRDVVGRWLVGRWLSRACTVAKRCIVGL